MPSSVEKSEQAISARELCVLRFRVGVTEENNTKVMPWKWYSEGKLEGNC